MRMRISLSMRLFKIGLATVTLGPTTWWAQGAAGDSGGYPDVIPPRGVIQKFETFFCMPWRHPKLTHIVPVLADHAVMRSHLLYELTDRRPECFGCNGVPHSSRHS